MVYHRVNYFFNKKMFKKLLIICPEFKDEYLRFQPWRQIYEIAKRLPKRKIEVVIATESTNKITDPDIHILYLEEKKIRNLHVSSIEKINNFNPDLIFWIGNPYSGLYLKNLKINNIPIILYISTMHMMLTELRNLSLKEIFPSHILQLFTAFFPFKKIVKNLNSLKISQIIVSNNTIKNNEIISPFKDKNTLSMDGRYMQHSWWVAYNLSKHDYPEGLIHATLGNVIFSLASAYVLHEVARIASIISTSAILERNHWNEKFLYSETHDELRLRSFRFVYELDSNFFVNKTEYSGDGAPI